jgi:hypothetical protein
LLEGREPKMKQRVSREQGGSRREQEGAGGSSEGTEEVEMRASERNGRLAGE